MTGQKGQPPHPDWRFIGRVLAKASLLFAICNLVFAALTPLEALGRLSLYNRLVPGRLRLPYGENIAESYNLSPTNLPAMFASHAVSRAKEAGEFRVVVLGDSGIWGWLLETEDTLTAQLNRLHLKAADGRKMTFYNLAYPQLSAAKDLLILDEVQAHKPDLIIWPVTLESLAAEKQLEPPLVRENHTRMALLARATDLEFDLNDSQWRHLDFWDQTILSRRRDLADLVRLQLLGVPWAATGIDQHIPETYVPRANDFEADSGWHGFTEDHPLKPADIALEILAAGVNRAGAVPVLIINEPIFIADGRSSDRRYNSFYPRPIYDRYRELLLAAARAGGWLYLDLWDRIPGSHFTDTPVHLDPAGTGRLAEVIAEELERRFGAGDR